VERSGDRVAMLAEHPADGRCGTCEDDEEEQGGGEMNHRDMPLTV
jgi:hypothetical protein